MTERQDNPPKVVTVGDLYDKIAADLEPRIKRLEVGVAALVATGLWNMVGRPTPDEAAAAILRLFGV